jgi:hypothetical protein
LPMKVTKQGNWKRDHLNEGDARRNRPRPLLRAAALGSSGIFGRLRRL